LCLGIYTLSHLLTVAQKGKKSLIEHMRKYCTQEREKEWGDMRWGNSERMEREYGSVGSSRRPVGRSQPRRSADVVREPDT
jgi:hypothetical protein